MKLNPKKIMLGMLIVALLGAGAAWYAIQQKLKPTEAYIRYCNNARLIHEQLVEFEKDYLELPSAEAMADDPEAKSLDLSSSNGYLGQLIIAAGRDSEEIFHIAESSVCSGSLPDNKVVPREEVLRAGENGWAYFKGRTIDGNAEPSQPLLVPGWNPDTKVWDDAIWKTGIPVLSADGSVVLYQADTETEKEGYRIRKDGLPFKKDDPDLIQPAAR
ncbi:MAG: hypothetical protein H7A51_05395 [Akkermansiaceae bacterium]|nr:hypothetical protein [Akkermansiaceae bacterium]